MLWIGDIHITSKWKGKIIEELDTFTKKFPDEKNIIFFGDYVYHFNYDRKALLGLFSFFVELYKQGKSLYILAGNHDWIADHFIYEEARQAFDIVEDISSSDEGGCIKFITQPEIVQIEGKDCLFFPFMHIKQDTFETSYFNELLASSHHKERLSGKANSLLYDMIVQWEQNAQKSSSLFVFHHRYIANTQFPGLWGKFSYKSPALDPLFCTMENIYLVSGHLHQSFAWENYLCLGSVWSTSPLETNQQKYLFSYDSKEDIVYPFLCTINPYIEGEIGFETKLTRETIESWHQQYIERSHASLRAGIWNIVFQKRSTALPLPYTTVSLISEDIGYDALEEKVEPSLYHSLYAIKLKRKKQSGGFLTEQLLDASSNLDKSIQDWKTLLLKYIDMKYKEDAPKYHDVLQSLDIL